MGHERHCIMTFCQHRDVTDTSFPPATSLRPQFSTKTRISYRFSAFPHTERDQSRCPQQKLGDNWPITLKKPASTPARHRYKLDESIPEIGFPGCILSKWPCGQRGRRVFHDFWVGFGRDHLTWRRLFVLSNKNKFLQFYHPLVLQHVRPVVLVQQNNVLLSFYIQKTTNYNKNNQTRHCTARHIGKRRRCRRRRENAKTAPQK